MPGGHGGPAARAAPRFQEALAAQRLVGGGDGGAAHREGQRELPLGGQSRGRRDAALEHEQPDPVGERPVGGRLAQARADGARLLCLELTGELGGPDRRGPLRHEVSPPSRNWPWLGSISPPQSGMTSPPRSFRGHHLVHAPPAQTALAVRRSRVVRHQFGAARARRARAPAVGGAEPGHRPAHRPLHR